MPSELGGWEFSRLPSSVFERASRRCDCCMLRRAVGAVFDEANLVSCAGLVPVMGLAERVDLAGLVGGRVSRTCRPGRIRAGRPLRSWRGCAPARTASMTWTWCGTAGWAAVRRRVRAVDVGVVPAVLHLGHALQLEAAGRDLLTALAAATPLLPGAATQTYRGRGFVAAQGLRPRQAGRVVRAREGRRVQRQAAWPVTAGRHDQHRPVGAGDRRDPAAWRQRRLQPGRGVADHAGDPHRQGVRRDRPGPGPRRLRVRFRRRGVGLPQGRA